MAQKSRIKGITIEIGGDTTGLNQALSKVDSSLKTTQASLRDVNKLLKLDPKNTELLRQKQELLNKAVKDTDERLKTLKNAYDNIKADSPEELKQKQDALNREIIETEQRLKSAQAEARNFGSVFKQQLQAVGDQMKEVGGKITDTGKDLTLKLTAPIVALGTIGVNYNAQIEQYQTMFTTLTGSAEEADRIISQLQADAQKSPFDSATLIQANQFLISAGVSADEARKTILDLGNAIAATGGGSAELERMSQNLQQIKNVGKATSQDIKQFANAGINIYGLLAEATGKTVEEVKEMDVSYDLLADALAKASAEGGKYYGAMEAQGQTLNGSLSATKESIQMLLGEITQAAMPIIVQVLGKIREVITWLSSLDDETKKRILLIASIVAAIGPVITIIGTIISGLGSLIGVIGMMMSPMGALVLAIGGLIAAGVALYQNWETIKEVASNVWNKLKEDFQAIINFFQEKIDWLVERFTAFKDAIRNAFDFSNITSKISGFFSSVGSLFGGGGMFSSGGFNGMSSGGFMSGSITLNNTFTITNGNNIDKATVIGWADVLTERINENLGRMV